MARKASGNTRPPFSRTSRLLVRATEEPAVDDELQIPPAEPVGPWFRIRLRYGWKQANAYAARLDNFVEHNAVIRLLGITAAILGFLVLIQTLRATNAQIEDRQKFLDELEASRLFREEERIALAFDTLMRRAGGQTRKGEAFAHLARSGQITGRINLSCRAIGAWDNGECIDPPVFSNLVMPQPPYWANIDFRNTEIESGDFRYSNTILDLRDATIQESVFTDLAYGNLQGTRFFNSDLGGVRFTLAQTLVETLIAASNISSLSVPMEPVFAGIYVSDDKCTGGMNTATGELADCLDENEALTIAGSWFWADRPPEFLKDKEVRDRTIDTFMICEPGMPKGRPGSARNLKTTPFFYGAPASCAQISMEDAVEKYPLWWDRDIKCEDALAIEFNRADRLSAAQPCIAVRPPVQSPPF